MRVLVTGAGGYIGQALAPALEKAGHTVTAPREMRYADVTDPYAMGAAATLADFRKPSADQATIHLACNTMGDWRANIAGVAFALDSLPRDGRFVFASSLTALEPRDQYDQEKRIGEFIVGSRPDISAVILRLGAVYGPGTQNKRSAFNAILRQIANGEQVNLYGNAGGRRDFLYIDDAVAAFVQALTVAPGIYDVGTGRSEPLTTAVGMACRAAGSREWPTSAPDITAEHMPTANPARFLPGWTPTVSLEQGVTKTLAWLRENEPAKELVTA